MHVVINGWFWNQPQTGSGQYLAHLVDYLPRVAPDLRFTLVVPKAGQAGKPVDQAALLSTVHVPLAVRSNLAKVWFEQVVFPRLCRQLQADVAHVPYWGSPLRPSVPTVVSILDLIPMLLPEYRGGPLVRLYTSLAAAAAPNAAQVITISQASQRDMVTHLGLSLGRVHVTYLAADEHFTAQPDAAGDAALRQSHLDLPQDYVLYLGGLDARKNIETLLQVCGWLQLAFGDSYPLVIAGRLPDRHNRFFRDPRVIARMLQVEDVVRCIGPVAEQHKPALYRNARAFVYPSRYEGFGLPALEALACGVPVVGSEASSIPEVVGDAGILVAPDDARQMAGGLIAILNDDKLRQELAQRAVAQAARFSWEQCAQQTVQVYEAALRDAPRRLH